MPPLTFADVDPAGVVESCLTVARPLAETAGLVLGARCRRNLPRIVADEVSLRQMLLNLLANAIKFARPRRPRDGERSPTMSTVRCASRSSIRGPA